jgi:hypothetical protein
VLKIAKKKPLNTFSKEQTNPIIWTLLFLRFFSNFSATLGYSPLTILGLINAYVKLNDNFILCYEKKHPMKFLVI